MTMTMTMMKTDGSTAAGGAAAAPAGAIVSSTTTTTTTTGQRSSEIGRLADAFRFVVDVRDRRYRSKTYQGCFIGSEAVDALVYHGLAESRDDAVVTVGRRLQTELRLFSHVRNDHDFKDGYLFYRFNDDDGTTNSNSSKGMVSMTTCRTTTPEVQQNLNRRFLSDLEEKAKVFYRLADVRDRDRRPHHNRFIRTMNKTIHRNVFVGSDVVDRMVYVGLAGTRWEAVQVGRSLATHFDMFEHVDMKHTFADGNDMFFRFNTDAIMNLVGGKIGIDDGGDGDGDDGDRGVDANRYECHGNSTIASDSGHTSDLSSDQDHSSSSSSSSTDDDYTPPPCRPAAAVVDLSVFKKKKTTTKQQQQQHQKRQNDFQYPEQLTAAPGTGTFRSGGSSSIKDSTPPSSVVTPGTVAEPYYQKQRRIINRLRHFYPNELLDGWKVVHAELKSVLRSLYTGHHEVVVESSSSLSRTDDVVVSALALPTTTKDSTSSSDDSITTVNYETTSTTPGLHRNGNNRELDLVNKSFDAFDFIVQKNSALSYDDADDTSLWTEYIVEEAEADGTGGINNNNNNNNNSTKNGQNNMQDDDVSYMEFTILEDETVDLSYIEESVVVASPKTVLLTPPPSVTAAGPPKETRQLLNGSSSSCNNSKTAIFVPTTTRNDDDDDDDMTAITLDPYFTTDTDSKKKNLREEANYGDTTDVAKRTTKKQQQRQRQQIIHTILRKYLSSCPPPGGGAVVDEDDVTNSLDILSGEVENFPVFIVQCGGIVAVLRTMETYPFNEPIQYLGCTILKDLATASDGSASTAAGRDSETNKAAINELDGISVVARSMRNHPHSDRVNDVARSALSAFL